MYKKSFHERNDSGELDVFEAARYFSSGTNDISGTTFAHKIIGEDRQFAAKGARRMSLDMPPTMMMRHSLPFQTEKQMKEKKYKQPSSPGGRLAHFLNSLFNQKSSKKKKSKSSTQSMKESEEESPGYRRKRRSSISFFQTMTNPAHSRSIHSSSSSGFRTPPAPYNPTKRNTDYACLKEKFKFSNGILEKNKNSNVGFSNRSRKNWSDYHYSSEEKEFKKINDIDDGADSDSSSDLFDLPNHDLDYFSSGLPVYETTNMNSIKRGAPISNGAV